MKKQAILLPRAQTGVAKEKDRAMKCTGKCKQHHFFDDNKNTRSSFLSKMQ